MPKPPAKKNKCLACQGSGKSSSGSACYPCKGRGVISAKKKFLVYFKQVNQQCYTVEADNEIVARGKAIILWQNDHSFPDVAEIEEGD